MTFAIEMQGITKRFGPLVANNDVALQVRKGEIHALVGENGAGKTTLMNVLFGLYQPDEGTLAINGRTVASAVPHGAQQVLAWVGSPRIAAPWHAPPLQRRSSATSSS